MTIAHTSILIDDEGAFIILPDEVAYGCDVELTLVRSGDVLTMYPSERPLPEPQAVTPGDDETGS